MNELSYIAKIKRALELAKLARTGCSLTLFDVIELKGYIESLEETIALYDNEPSNSDVSMTEDIPVRAGVCEICQEKAILEAEKTKAELEKWKEVAKDLADELMARVDSKLFPVWKNAGGTNPAWIAYCNLRDKEK